MLSVKSTVLRLITIGWVCTFSMGGCALNRTEVKSLRDPTAARIQFDTAVDTTISALNAIPSHCRPTGNRRVRDEELRVYRVEGTITRVKRERDHDIHIVLADTMNPEDHLVIESDDPSFGKNAASPYRDRLAAARRMLDALVSDSSGHRFDDLKGTVVRVTGVGFFDLNHLQKGRSRSCIELHPILTIERVNEISGQTPDAPFDASPRYSRSIRVRPNASREGSTSREATCPVRSVSAPLGIRAATVELCAECSGGRRNVPLLTDVADSVSRARSDGDFVPAKRM